MKLRSALRIAPLALLGAGALATSFVTIANDEQGVVERFGGPVRDLVPGLHMKLPWPIESVRRTSSGQRSLQMPIGFRLVDEAAGLAPPPGMTQWLTGDSNIVELRANVLYRVADARAWLYGVSPVHSTDPASRDGAYQGRAFALRRLGESALTELVSREDVDDVLGGGAARISADARKLVQARADALGLGVEISAVQILRRDPLASVAAAFRRVQDAEADAEQARQRNLANRRDILSRAAIERETLLSDARVDADAARQAARGRADRFLALAREVGSVDSSQGRRLWIEAVRDLLLRADLKVVQPGTAERPTVIYATGGR